MRTWRSTLTGIGFGLLTWSVAHVTTLAAFAHIHPGFVVHYHGWAGPLAIAVLMLTVTSLAAAGGTLVRPPVTGRSLSALNGALAPAVFVAVEFVEYLTGVHEAPPAALLIIGCLVHAAIGTAAPTLWTLLSQGARGYVVMPYAGQRPGARGLTVRPAGRVWATGSAAVHGGSRAPPLRRGILAPVVC